MADKKNKEDKHALLTQVVAELYNTVGPDQVLFKHKREDNKEVWYLGTRQLTDKQLLNFAQEAEIISKLGLWEEIQNCMKYLSKREMFLKAGTIDDMIGGKMLLFHLNNVNKIIETAIKIGANFKK